MVRPIGILAGLGFVAVLLWSLVWGAVAFIQEPPQPTAEHEFHKHPRDAGLSSAGLLGKYDRQQLQRGFQVYKEVCAACHGLKYVAFRDLQDLGYSEAEVKAIADQWAIETPSVNPETGEAATRKNLPADNFPSPYPNEVAARAANNNALPPDLSLIAKARHDGSNYVYSLLTGYRDPSPELLREFPDSKPGQGLYHNPYFANLNIAMPPPIVSEGQVTYTDGTRPTVDQMSKDVAAFLTWTAEPKLEQRKSAGLASLVFILVFCFLAWGAYKNVWRGEPH
ncbi:cytochrome c1 [Sphingomonas gilva]|uniref:Cytochrome c1 n=1 Tax=Sphingomonas gilva TaxID=2305907 RepID=A0A396S7J7_9SPHN|nr:cytochrome c1 [Sphingomonas gilva]RHW19375.1 cytochrome c1 [Sphingomonas gilva]